jgi:NDP-sugar pyrophosphorylase family protein
MRAIIIATSARQAMSSLTRFHPTYLLRIADKPMIFYVIESLVNQGIFHIDMILRDSPFQIEEALADGKRWGAFITYHLATHEEFPFAPMVPALESWSDEKVVLGVGDTLPDFSPAFFQENDQEKGIAIMYPVDGWSGWCVTPAKILKSVNKKTSFNEFSSWIQKNAFKVNAQPLFSTQTFENLLNSNKQAISKLKGNFLLPSTAQHVEEGVWLSRGISMHPSAKIEPPVFIGEYCQIHPGVQIGPYAVIENHCIADANSVIQNSLICQNSYVGENLNIQESIIDRNLLINFTHHTAILIREDFILSEINEGSLIRVMIHYMSRIAALLMFITLSPIYLYLKLTCPMQTSKVVCLPASEEPSHWKFFEWQTFDPPRGCEFDKLKNYFKSLPLLIQVFKGTVHFVGVIPRTKEEITQLPGDWQKLYLKSKIGLIVLGNLEYGPAISQDELYASETYYGTQMSIYFDFKLFFRWLKKKLFFKVRA